MKSWNGKSISRIFLLYISISWIFPLFIANGALTENRTGNTPIQDASGISQTSKPSSELQEDHRGSNSPEPSNSTVSISYTACKILNNGILNIDF